MDLSVTKLKMKPHWILSPEGDLFCNDLRYNDYRIENFLELNQKYLDFVTRKPTMLASDCGNYCTIAHHNTVDIYKADEGYLYSIRKNTYKSSELNGTILAIYKDKLIINKYHGQLSVLNIENGHEIHSEKNDDRFLLSYKRYGDYLVVNGYYWARGEMSFVYHLDEFTRCSRYKSRLLNLEHDKQDELKMNSNGSINLYDNSEFNHVFTLEEFHKYPGILPDLIWDIRLTNSINKPEFRESIVDKLLSPAQFTHLDINCHPGADQKLLEIIRRARNDEIVEIRCYGNQTQERKWSFPKDLLATAKKTNRYGEKLEIQDDFRELLFVALFDSDPYNHKCEIIDFYLSLTFRDVSVKIDFYQSMTEIDPDTKIIPGSFQSIQNFRISDDNCRVVISERILRSIYEKQISTYIK